MEKKAKWEEKRQKVKKRVRVRKKDGFKMLKKIKKKQPLKCQKL